MQQRVQTPPDRQHQQADADQTGHAEAMDQTLHIGHQRDLTHGRDGKRGAQRPSRTAEIAQEDRQKGIVDAHAHAGERRGRYQRPQSWRCGEVAELHPGRRDRTRALRKPRGDRGRRQRKDGVQRQDQLGIGLRHLRTDHKYRHGESNRAPQPDAPEAAVVPAEVRQRHRRHQRQDARPHHRHGDHRQQERHKCPRGPQAHRSSDESGTGQGEQAFCLPARICQHAPHRLRDHLHDRQHTENHTGLRRRQTAGQQRQRHEGNRGDVHVHDGEK